MASALLCEQAMIRVRVVVEIEVDSAAYVAAGIEADHYGRHDVNPNDLEDVAYAATSYFDAEDNLPRWARDTMRVISQTTEVDL